MKRTCQMVCLLLVLFCLLGAATVANAAVENHDGMEVTLSTDRQEYAEGEQVVVTLSVRNMGDKSLTDVQMSNQIPGKLALGSGEQMEKTVPALYPGETATLKTTFVLSPTGSLPLTGDSSHMLIWLFVLSIAVFAWFGLKGKNASQITAGILCFVIAFSAVYPCNGIASAKADGGINIDIVQNIVLFGMQTVVEATVCSNEAGDPGEISFAYPDSAHMVYDQENELYYLDNQILIITEADVPRSEVEKMIEPHAGRIVGWIQLTGDYQIEFPHAMSKAELMQIVQKIREQDGVQSAELHELRAVETSAIYDQLWLEEEWSARSNWTEGWINEPGGWRPSNWNMMAVDALDAWKYANEMETVNVGVYDNIFAEDHKDLEGVFGEVWNNDQNAAIEGPDHGTHVAGIIGAKHGDKYGVLGVSPKSRIYAYSCEGKKTDNVASDADFEKNSRMEVKYACAKMITADCRILNFSYGLSGKLNLTLDGHSKRDGEIFSEYISKLVRANFDFVIVQAAGNDNKEAKYNGFFVQCDDETRERIIVVGNLGYDENDDIRTLPERYNYYDDSNYGEIVDVIAPGQNIYSCIRDGWGNNGEFRHAYLSGTSMSAPLVAGIAAMCYGVNPNLTGPDVKKIIVETAEESGVSVKRNNTGRDYYVVNAGLAVEKARRTSGDYEPPKAKGIVMGHVKREWNFGYSNLEDVRVALHTMNSLGAPGAPKISETTDEYGNYEIAYDEGTYGLSYYKDGYKTLLIRNVDVPANEVTYIEDVVLLKESNRNGKIKGVIRDAVTNEPIEGVRIVFVPDWGNTNAQGEEAGRVYTNEKGEYSFEVKEGYYTALLFKPGYADSYINVYSENLVQIGDQNGVMTPGIENNRYRAVLTWGSTPLDLDSHLSGPLSNGDRYHVFYSNKTAQNNGTWAAELDRDDVDSYGPETTTLMADQDGVYRYAVHDYSNRNSGGSTALSRSGAKVELYSGERLIKVFHVPIDQQGTVWNVFEIDQGEIRSVNTMESIASPENVGRGISAFGMRMRRTDPIDGWHEDDKLPKKE